MDNVMNCSRQNPLSKFNYPVQLPVIPKRPENSKKREAVKEA